MGFNITENYIFSIQKIVSENIQIMNYSLEETIGLETELE